MLMNKRYSIATLLVISGLLLASLIPGGPIETRDFSHINPLVLGLFNLFLTVLGLGALIVAFFQFRGRDLAGLSLFMGVSYLVVYSIDLLAVFPKTVSEMPLALFAIEVAGCVIALPLIALAYALSRSKEGITASEPFEFGHTSIIALALLSVVILAFATFSAMGL